MLKLLTRLSDSRVEPTVEALAATKAELSLRTVIQFMKVSILTCNPVTELTVLDARSTILQTTGEQLSTLPSMSPFQSRPLTRRSIPMEM